MIDILLEPDDERQYGTCPGCLEEALIKEKGFFKCLDCGNEIDPEKWQFECDLF